ncbi:hypothetical protein [Sinomonas sp. ASV322]|uniref:hypothetical protein n=1 Tax=Sinomonas sp. ASV322 TaxID=3041920 RepID=UPI0027DD9C9E|nr:hypothetical protein [Sinomonas sp. ASV322]MDQ4502184.1 hypothetical protein [Sinomonas sp. ASV322]
MPKAPAPKPASQVVEDSLHFQTSEGEVVIPLRFKTKLLRRIRKMDELDAFFEVIDNAAGQETAELIDELDSLETAGIVEAFFKAYQEKVDATLGESRRSSS